MDSKPASELTTAAIAKLLASSNARTRNRAVRLLSSFLPSQPPDSFLTVWKPLFYSFWHSDKPASHLLLADQLSGLLLLLAPPPSLSAQFLSAFLLTLRREWPGIDFLRLDKFYLLIRRFLSRTFELLRDLNWDLPTVRIFADVFLDNALLPDDKVMGGAGVGYQIADAFFDEMHGVMPVPVEGFEVLVGAFMQVLARSKDRVLVGKVRAGVFEKLIGHGRKLIEEGKDDEGKFGSIAIAMGLSGKLLELGSAEGTLTGNRKVLFALRDGFLKLEKDAEKSGVSVEVLHLEHAENGGGDSENIESLSESGSEEGKGKKKRKKGKKVSESDEKKSAKLNKAKKDSESNEKKIGKLNKSKKDSESNEKKSGKLNKLKKDSDSKEKNSKSKKKKNDSLDSEAIKDDVVEEIDSKITNDTNDTITFDQMIISNLQKQFEKVAAEAGMNAFAESLSASPTTPVDSAIPKKRKRAKSAAGKVSDCAKIGDIDSTAVKGEDQSVKRVRFSMKNNVVWKPHNPLPPESVRLPPSATPRGSALKKGVPPGPIRASPPTAKKINVMSSSVKRGKKSIKTPTVVVKRIRKLPSFSV